MIDFIADITGNKVMAEMIVERLQEERLLSLGYGDTEIDQVVKKFKDTFGTTRSSKYDRFAARRLVAKYGTKSVFGVIELLAEKSDEKYAPVVNDVSQLEKKFVSVLSFLRKNTAEDTTLDVDV